MRSIVNFLIFFALFPLVAIVGIKRRKDENGSLIDRDDSRFIRGFATCGVFLAHSESYLSGINFAGSRFLKPFSVMGGIGVLLFFFVSGYGLWKSYSGNMNIGKYWKKRLLNTFLPAILIEAAFAIESLTRKNTFTLNNFLFETFVDSWFIDVIMIEYVIFFLSFIISHKIKKDNLNLMLGTVFVFDMVIAVAFFVMGLDDRWYNGLMLFPVGMFLAYKENSFKKSMDKKWFVWFAMSILSFAGFGMVFWLFKGAVWANLLKTLAGIALSVLFTVFFRRFSLGNKVMNWVGDKSLYVYLIHVGILDILFTITWSDYYDLFYVWGVAILLVSTIVISHGVFILLNPYFSKKRGK